MRAFEQLSFFGCFEYEVIPFRVFSLFHSCVLNQGCHVKEKAVFGSDEGLMTTSFLQGAVGIVARGLKHHDDFSKYE